MFAISQLFSIYAWARLSGALASHLCQRCACSQNALDVIGRRPVILAGVIGVAFATLMFGFSNTFVAVLITRCLGACT